MAKLTLLLGALSLQKRSSEPVNNEPIKITRNTP